ncbi:MAG: short chain fatty acid transporter [Bacteroidetes bacterium HGW-Bacteroidetes-22]|nr:MAG: short chain fatty acid transporter [Bacteroidetes bacterium HGW-Bacteroidetes-22]
MPYFLFPLLYINPYLSSIKKTIMGLKKNFRSGVPDPLVLALLLTFLTMILALALGTNPGAGIAGVADVLSYWVKGFWDLLTFSMQMVLILLLGYMLALSPIFDSLSTALTRLSRNPVQGAVAVTIIAVVFGLINWGLALVFGAVFVKKIAMQAERSGHAINYPLMGASAYICMMIWHGGLSGSAPLSVASDGHFLVAKTGIIPLNLTVFSPLNIAANAALLVLLPLATWIMARKGKLAIPSFETSAINRTEDSPSARWRPTVLSVAGFLLLAGFIISTFFSAKGHSIGLNEINLILFSLVLIAMPTAEKISKTAGDAVGSTAGIIIQFPLYAGIMGIMQYSGLLNVMTQWFVNISTPATFPLYSFISAGIVNLFVPSGGGQWAVQGPLIIDSATALGLNHARSVMALAYGDQLTNMLQPFWALPLLGITGLKAGDIFRYSYRFMIIGFIVFSLFLLFF